MQNLNRYGALKIFRLLPRGVSKYEHQSKQRLKNESNWYISTGWIKRRATSRATWAPVKKRQGIDRILMSSPWCDVDTAISHLASTLSNPLWIDHIYELFKIMKWFANDITQTAQLCIRHNGRLSFHIAPWNNRNKCCRKRQVSAPF